WLKIFAKERNQLSDPKKKPRLPTNLETLKEIVNKTQPNLPTDLLIFDYDKIIPTIDALYKKFDFQAAPPYLFQLLDQPKPEWDLYDYDDAYI
ncbi:34422_t:CDS:1, partial [Gigaspora margarita]